MKTIFPQDFVYVLRTTTRHMVSFIDFYFHFLANFGFFIFTHGMSRDTHSEPRLSRKSVKAYAIMSIMSIGILGSKSLVLLD